MGKLHFERKDGILGGKKNSECKVKIFKRGKKSEFLKSEFFVKFSQNSKGKGKFRTKNSEKEFGILRIKSEF